MEKNEVSGVSEQIVSFADDKSGKGGIVENGSIVVDKALALYSGLEEGRILASKQLKAEAYDIYISGKVVKTREGVFYLFDDGTFRLYQEYRSEVQTQSGENTTITYITYTFYKTGYIALGSSKVRVPSIRCGDGNYTLNGKYDSTIFNDVSFIDYQFSGSAYLCRA